MNPGGLYNAPKHLAEERDKLTNLEGTYIELTRQAAADNADVIIWSEKFFPADPLNKNELKNRLEEMADQLDSTLIITFVSEDRNIALPIVPGEGFGTPYQKLRIAEILGEMHEAGSERPVYSTSWGKFGLLICYDMHYEENTRLLAESGANIIAVSSNAGSLMNSRAWVKRTASIRAAENHLPFFVSTDVGSYIVDSNGKVIDSTPGEPSYSIASLALSDSQTIYKSFGHNVRWGLVGLFVIALAYAPISRSRNAASDHNRTPS
jgi:apolipoprotein N-acyltransferase